MPLLPAVKRLLCRQLVLRALIVVGCVGLQLSGTVHLALVQHAYCAEHGETVDVHHDAELGSSQASRPAQAAYQPAEERDHGEGHHHCRLDEDRSTHALVVYAALLALHAPAPVVHAPPYAPHARVTPRLTQLLAPKTSPPVA